MGERCTKVGTENWAYCLMPNHAHLILAPAHKDRLRAALGAKHRRYTRHINAHVGFDMGDDGTIAVDAKDGPPHLADESMEADCTIRVSADNMAKLIAGQLNPMLAYTLGKLKIDGSMGVAMKVAALLED